MRAAAERRRVATSRRRDKGVRKTTGNKNHDAQVNDGRFNSDDNRSVGKAIQR